MTGECFRCGILNLSSADAGKRFHRALCNKEAGRKRDFLPAFALCGGNDFVELILRQYRAALGVAIYRRVCYIRQEMIPPSRAAHEKSDSEMQIQKREEDTV